MYRILAADIGGTNSRFALFTAEEEAPHSLTLLRERWYSGSEYPSFSDLLQALVAPNLTAKGGESTPFLVPEEGIDLAVLAPAGPVEGEVCRLSNLPWIIKTCEVRRILGIPSVYLINDFAAQGYACLRPERLELLEIQAGVALPGAPFAVVGGGTGLGKALVLRGEDENATRVLPTEGGHADFPFVDEEECDFAAFVRRHTGRDTIIGDMVVTGPGLAHIYAYMTKERLPERDVPGRLQKHPDVLEWFARFYGRACRNFVLDTLALGGLYITGGMALRVPVLSHPAFMDEFCRSAAQRGLLANVPIRHVRSPQAGLWGAALFGMLRKK